MRSTPLILALLSLLVVACDDNEKKGGAASASATAAPPSAAPIASATAAPAPSPVLSSATPPPKCADGFTGIPVPAFCIKLPASYRIKEARVTPKKGTIEYDTGNATDNLTITYDETSLKELVSQTEGEMKFGGDKVTKKGDLPKGNKFFEGTHADYVRIVTLVQAAPPLTIKCSFAYKPAAAPSKEAIDACRSIVLP